MDPIVLFNLISLLANTALKIPAVQSFTKGDYSQLASLLESAIAPLIALIPGWIKGGPGGPSATISVLTGYATALGVLNALAKQPGLPQALLDEIAEYAKAGQDGITGYIEAGRGFDPALFTPVEPMPPIKG